jgi:hypothetical protein
MSFPLMPIAKPPQFVKGALTYRASTFGSVDCGQPSEDRWIVVAVVRFSTNGFGAYTAPTIDGVAMTEIIQDYSSFSSDGHRLAVWAKKVTTGTLVTIVNTSAEAIDLTNVYTLTGVVSPLTSVLLTTTNVLTQPVNSCVIGCYVTNGGSITSVTDMTFPVTHAYTAIGYDLQTATNPITYTEVIANLVLRRLVSWSFDY